MANAAKKILDLLPKMKASFAQLSKEDVLVGVPSEGPKREETSVKNATIAYVQDNGSPAQNIPARPFMLPGIEAVKPRIANIFKNSAKKAMKGDQGAMNQGLHKAGQVAVASIQRVINSNISPELSEGTLAARKRRGVSRTNTLVDTGQLRNSINYVIRSK